MAGEIVFYPRITWQHMHVLLLPSWYFPAGSPEIAGRMFHHLAMGLREEGVDARIMYPDHSIRAPIIKKTTFQPEEGVPTWRSRQWLPPKTNSLFMQWWIRRFISELKAYFKKAGKPDLLHAHSYMTACACAALNKKIKIPFIYTERLSGFITNKIPGHHDPCIRQSLEAASAITCVSPGLQDVLQTRTTKPIQVIPNFYDDRIFYPEPHASKSKVSTWVSIGEPAHIKGLDILFHAFAAVRKKLNETEMELILIDQIPEKNELLLLAETLGIAKNILWTGLIPQTDVAVILRESHVLISASRVETFGKAILEAQACGLPVIATPTAGAHYILSSSLQGELLVDHSSEALTKAMEKMYKDYTAYDAFAIQAEVEKRFSKKIVLHQWIELYQSVRS